MKIVESVVEMTRLAGKAREDGKTVSFVPTMGFLHEGHASLVRTARERGDILVVSIFVNPTQFGPGEDLDRYPRDLERDERTCRALGVDILFRPPSSEMYPGPQSAWVDETSLSKGLCGASRPGHFRGVTTVVAKLFNIVGPDLAVFGKKDAQQARIIQRMVKDLNFPVEILLGETVREADGLALSSRNSYLSSDQRRVAPSIYKGLCEAERLFRGGETDARKLESVVRDAIEAAARSSRVEHAVEYVSLVNLASLEPTEQAFSGTLLATAVRIGSTRLIDNVWL